MPSALNCDWWGNLQPTRDLLPRVRGLAGRIRDLGQQKPNMELCPYEDDKAAAQCQICANLATGVVFSDFLAM